MQLSSVMQLFEGINETELQRPEGKVDVLSGFEYADCLPVQEKSVEHLLFMRNRFGVCLGRSHRLLKEKTKKLVQNVFIIFESSSYSRCIP